MTCRDLVARLGDHAAGELAPDLLTRLDGHLSRCADCRCFVAQYLETIVLCRTACADAANEGDAEALHAILRAVLSADVARHRRGSSRQ